MSQPNQIEASLVVNKDCKVPSTITIDINVDDFIDDLVVNITHEKTSDELVKIFWNIKNLVREMTFYYLEGVCYTRSDIILQMVYLHDIIKYFQCKNNQNWLMNQTGIIYGVNPKWAVDYPCICRLCVIT